MISLKKDRDDNFSPPNSIKVTSANAIDTASLLISLLRAANIAEFRINGETIKTGGAGKMGSELYEEMGLWSPKEGWETSINHPTAGSYRAIGLDLQGANPEQAARLKQQLEATKAKLESADDVQLATLTKHNLVGDLLYGTVFNYFALNDLQGQIAAQSADVLNYRLPSFGTFSTNLQTQYCNLHP